jgi:hypothetical protein
LINQCGYNQVFDESKQYCIDATSKEDVECILFKTKVNIPAPFTTKSSYVDLIKRKLPAIPIIEIASEPAIEPTTTVPNLKLETVTSKFDDGVTLFKRNKLIKTANLPKRIDPPPQGYRKEKEIKKSSSYRKYEAKKDYNQNDSNEDNEDYDDEDEDFETFDLLEIQRALNEKKKRGGKQLSKKSDEEGRKRNTASSSNDNDFNYFY